MSRVRREALKEAARCVGNLAGGMEAMKDLPESKEILKAWALQACTFRLAEREILHLMSRE